MALRRGVKQQDDEEDEEEATNGCYGCSDGLIPRGAIRATAVNCANGGRGAIGACFTAPVLEEGEERGSASGCAAAASSVASAANMALSALMEMRGKSKEEVEEEEERAKIIDRREGVRKQRSDQNSYR